MKALLIVCAYNEGVKLRDTAKRMAQAIRAHSRAELQIEGIIIDDGSTDGVPESVTREHGFAFVRNDPRKGVGRSILVAYQYGLERGFDLFLTMAGNNKDNPDEIKLLLDEVLNRGSEFVQGSRYLPGGKYGNMPLYRRISTQYLHPWLFSFVSGQKITDSTNGFRAVTSKILRDSRIDLTQDWLKCYELEPYLFCMAIRLGYKVTEVPVSKIYPDHKLGYSKMAPITGWWSILRPLFYLMFKVRK